MRKTYKHSLRGNVELQYGAQRRTGPGESTGAVSFSFSWVGLTLCSVCEQVVTPEAEEAQWAGFKGWLSCKGGAYVIGKFPSWGPGEETTFQMETNFKSYKNVNEICQQIWGAGNFPHA